jgi:hypothetical protein
LSRHKPCDSQKAVTSLVTAFLRPEKSCHKPRDSFSPARKNANFTTFILLLFE